MVCEFLIISIFLWNKDVFFGEKSLSGWCVWCLGEVKFVWMARYNGGYGYNWGKEEKINGSYFVLIEITLYFTSYIALKYDPILRWVVYLWWHGMFFDFVCLEQWSFCMALPMPYLLLSIIWSAIVLSPGHTMIQTKHQN